MWTNILLNVIIMPVYLMPFRSMKTSLLDYPCHEVTYFNLFYATLIYRTFNYSLRDLLHILYSTLYETVLLKCTRSRRGCTGAEKLYTFHQSFFV